MTNLVAINEKKPNANTIDLLTAALERAKSGELQLVMMSGICVDNVVTTAFSEDFTIKDAVWVSTNLHQRVMRMVEDNPQEPVQPLRPVEVLPKFGYETLLANYQAVTYPNVVSEIHMGLDVFEKFVDYVLFADVGPVEPLNMKERIERRDRILRGDDFLKFLAATVRQARIAPNEIRFIDPNYKEPLRVIKVDLN